MNFGPKRHQGVADEDEILVTLGSLHVPSIENSCVLTRLKGCFKTSCAKNVLNPMAGFKAMPANKVCEVGPSTTTCTSLQRGKRELKG